jgi:hypothetical protein
MKKQSSKKLNLSRETLAPLQSLDTVHGGQAAAESVSASASVGPTITVCSIGFTLPVCCASVAGQGAGQK